MNTKKIVNFIFELGHLKIQPRSGWWFAGVKNPESVAEHVMRAAQIGWILAEMEGDVDPRDVACMLLVHDNGDISDLNTVNRIYFTEKDKAEKGSFFDQLELLGGGMAEKWGKYFDEFEEKKTKAAMIARDADSLEAAFEAKKLLSLGHKPAQEWIDGAASDLKTKSARKIMAAMKETEFFDWWQSIKLIDKNKS
jgi:putative hydrolases of HD superfamily